MLFILRLLDALIRAFDFVADFNELGLVLRGLLVQQRGPLFHLYGLRLHDELLVLHLAALFPLHRGVSS